MRTKICAQGEVNVYLVDELPEGLIANTDRDHNGRPIVGHSEKGNHHVLGAAVELLEKPDAPVGMRVLYALLDEPTALIQDAPGAHEPQMLAAGTYEFRISREYDPFADQVRRVAD